MAILKEEIKVENQDFTNNESACENEAWQNQAEQNEQISKMEALSTTEIDITTIGKSEKSNAKKTFKEEFFIIFSNSPLFSGTFLLALFPIKIDSQTWTRGKNRSS